LKLPVSGTKLKVVRQRRIIEALVRKRDKYIFDSIADLKDAVAAMSSLISYLVSTANRELGRAQETNEQRPPITAGRTNVAYNKRESETLPSSRQPTTIHGCAVIKDTNVQLHLNMTSNRPPRPPSYRSIYVGNLCDETADNLKEYVNARHKDLYSEEISYMRIYPLLKKTSDENSPPIDEVKAGSFRVVIPSELATNLLHGFFGRKGLLSVNGNTNLPRSLVRVHRS
jgi:hypothetical protein